MPAPECDLLQYELNDAPIFLRKKVPEGYSWMQKKVSNEAGILTRYVQNPYVSEELWNTLFPYFLPEHFPEKTALDRIFSKRGVLNSFKSMTKAGFIIITNSKDKIVVAKHPYLKGYLIKAYTEDKEILDWYWWKKRIDGIQVIQEKITQYGFQGIMKTPKKWIYPLPPEPFPKGNQAHRKNFILIVQDMDILDNKKNLKAYQTKMTPQILDAFYILLTELLLIDSIYADNTPFCKDGKMAFIDSEHILDTTQPLHLTKVASYLSPEMYKYWEQLIVNGGPKR